MSTAVGSSSAERLSGLDVIELFRIPSRGEILDIGMPIDRDMPQGERSELFPFSMAQTVTPSHTPRRSKCPPRQLWAA